MSWRVETVLLTTWLLACGPQPPVATGEQTVASTDPQQEVTLRVKGPEGVSGTITPSDPAYFSVQVRVAGPALGIAYVDVENPHPNGCNLSGHLPAYLELDEGGEAEIEAWVSFWAADACEFDIGVRVASEYDGQYKNPDTGEFRSYVMRGDIEHTHLRISFRNLGES